MAEWVLKGSLKGPQGDPGQDAQLPAGGTEGQVLTKTSGGEAWADVPQPDMTGVVKYADGNLVSDGLAATQIIASENISNAYSFIKGSGTTASVAAASGPRVIGMSADGSSVEFSMGSKSVTSITDAISDSPAGEALVTDKAVADYVAATVPDVSFASDEDFCEYMGIPYTPTLLAQDGVSITENRSTKDGDSVHIEADIVVDSGKSGVLFSVPASVAPKTPKSKYVSFKAIGTVISRAGAIYPPVNVTLGTDGSVSLEDAFTMPENLEGTVTFDYSLQ